MWKTAVADAPAQIKVTHSASWWLTSLDSPYFKSLELAIEDVWGVKPLKIREGGTVPTIFWLETEFGAPCVHLPLGQVSDNLQTPTLQFLLHFGMILEQCRLINVQSSDAGHLANERMRLVNLR